MDESHAHCAEEHAVPAEHAEHPHDLERQRSEQWIDRHDVEGQSAPHEFDREHIVREHRVDVLFDSECGREVQGWLDDEQIRARAEPQHQIGGITVSAQSENGVREGKNSADDDGQFEDGERPILQGQRIAELEEPTGLVAGETEPRREVVEGGRTQIRHQLTPGAAVSAVYHLVTS